MLQKGTWLHVLYSEIAGFRDDVAPYGGLIYIKGAGGFSFELSPESLAEAIKKWNYWLVY